MIRKNDFTHRHALLRQRSLPCVPHSHRRRVSHALHQSSGPAQSIVGSKNDVILLSSSGTVPWSL